MKNVLIFTTFPGTSLILCVQRAFLSLHWLTEPIRLLKLWQPFSVLIVTHFTEVMQNTPCDQNGFFSFIYCIVIVF